ncbi:MAG: ABC transporter permease [Planctomycetota bacterium]
MHTMEWWQVGLAMIFIVMAGAASLALHLRLHGSLLWGAFRTFVQLSLLGFLLQYILAWTHPLPILLLFSGMILFAAMTVRGRIGKKGVATFLPTLVTMFLGYLVIALLVHGVIVGAKPWYAPRYFVPLSGMLVGNSLNAVALGLDRLLSDLKVRRSEVETALAVGATPAEASDAMFREALRAAMIPSINSMMAAGIVFIPGMMTGQIMAGADPVEAVKYQIVIMLMLVGSTAVTTVIVLLWVRRLCFTGGQALRRF